MFAIQMAVIFATLCVIRYTRRRVQKNKSTQTRPLTMCRGTQTLVEADVIDSMSIEDLDFEIDEFFYEVISENS